MRLLILASLLVSASAFASELVSQKVAFHVGGRVLGREIYYSCESVRYAVKKHLVTLGAENVRVSCSGGLDHFNRRNAWPALVRASFDAPVATGTEVEALTIKGRSCLLNVTILENIIPVLPTVSVVSKKANCSRSDDPWAYNLNIAQ